MNRDEQDVFQPQPVWKEGRDEARSSFLPDPGPHPNWTAEGVIEALEPLTTDERRERLRETLKHRIGSVTVLFDNPHDPHNGSAVLRSCDAFGVQRVHILRGEEEFAASHMVAKGSQRWVDVIEHRDPVQTARRLKQEGFKLLVTHPEGRLAPEDLRAEEKVAFILGNERDGVCKELTEAADDTVRIPMCGFVESLNVSVTGAILVQSATSSRRGDLDDVEAKNTYARWLRRSVPRADEVLSSFTPS